MLDDSWLYWFLAAAVAAAVLGGLAAVVVGDVRRRMDVRADRARQERLRRESGDGADR